MYTVSYCTQEDLDANQDLIKRLVKERLGWTILKFDWGPGYDGDAGTAFLHIDAKDRDASLEDPEAGDKIYQLQEALSKLIGEVYLSAMHPCVRCEKGNVRQYGTGAPFKNLLEEGEDPLHRWNSWDHFLTCDDCRHEDYIKEETEVVRVCEVCEEEFTLQDRPGYLTTFQASFRAHNLHGTSDQFPNLSAANSKRTGGLFCSQRCSVKALSEALAAFQDQLAPFLGEGEPA